MSLSVLLARLLRWIAARLDRAAEARRDEVLVKQNQEAADAASNAQAGAPVSRSALADGVRSGRDF